MDAAPRKLPPLELLEPEGGAISPEARNLWGAALSAGLKRLRLPAGVRFLRQDGPCVLFSAEDMDETARRTAVNLLEELGVLVGVRPVVLEPGPAGKPVIRLPVAHEGSVSLSRLVESFSRWAEAERMGLPVALGRRSDGTLLWEDLSAMPHLLVSGPDASLRVGQLLAAAMTLVMTRETAEVGFLVAGRRDSPVHRLAGLAHLIAEPAHSAAVAGRDLAWAAAHVGQRGRAGGVILRMEPGARKSRRCRPPSSSRQVVLVVDGLEELLWHTGEAACRSFLRIMRSDSDVHLLVAVKRSGVPLVNELIESGACGHAYVSRREGPGGWGGTTAPPGAATGRGGGAELLYVAPGGAEIERLEPVVVHPSELEAVKRWMRERLPPPAAVAPLAVTGPLPQTDDLFERILAECARSPGISTAAIARNLAQDAGRIERATQAMTRLGLLSGEVRRKRAPLVTPEQWQESRQAWEGGSGRSGRQTLPAELWRALSRQEHQRLREFWEQERESFRARLERELRLPPTDAQQILEALMPPLPSVFCASGRPGA